MLNSYQIETEEKLNRNLLRIDEKLDINEKNFEKVFDALEAADLPKQGVFCDGQIFDSYKFVSDLIRKAKASLVLVDNYVDDTVLLMLDKRKSGVSATIYTQSISKQLTLDLQKHNKSYIGKNSLYRKRWYQTGRYYMAYPRFWKVFNYGNACKESDVLQRYSSSKNYSGYRQN